MNIASLANVQSESIQAVPSSKSLHFFTIPMSTPVPVQTMGERLKPFEEMGFSVWAEKLPFGIDHPMSLRLLEREKRFKLHDDQGRAVLFVGNDGKAVLTIAASHGHTSLQDLRLAICAAIEGDPISIGRSGVAVSDDAPLAEWSVPTCDWGLGTAPVGHDREIVVIQTEQLEPSQAVKNLIGAFGTLLARYGHQNLTLPTLFVSEQKLPQFGLFYHNFAAGSSTSKLVEHAQTLQPANANGVLEDPASIGVRIVEVDDRESYAFCGAAPFGVSLDITVTSSGTTTAELSFEPSVMSPDIADEVTQQMIDLSSALTSGSAEGPADNVDILSETRSAEILSLGDHSQDAATPSTIVDLFDQVADQNPDGIALEFEDQSLSYAMLRQRSITFGSALTAMGVLAGDKVGICLPRGIDLIVSMLAIARIGAAYVPMDPSYPADRLLYSAKDAALTLVIANEGDFPENEATTCVTPAEVTQNQSADIPTGGPAPDDVAYVIYTSGSTGRPKGVAIPHRCVSTLIGATQKGMQLGSDDVWTLFHSSAFDFSVWEIWGALLTGGKLIIVPFWMSRDTEEFHEFLARKRVSVLNQTPSAFYALQKADATRPVLHDLRLVIFGGEALNARALVDWYRRYPSSVCRVINMYGITETTVHVTQQLFTPAMAVAGVKTVGTALPGWSISIRNAQGAVQPLGVSGEIWVGGAALAQEYLNRADLTKDRFVQDPLSGTRQYRSGDLGRLHPNGTLDHLGRIDSQVKIRGFRIELGEIRAVIEAVDGVKEAAVLVNEGDAKDKSTMRLEAFVVFESKQTTDRLRKAIARSLPDYMIPAKIYPVDKLLLTVNGKLDAKGLLAMAQDLEKAPSEALPAEFQNAPEETNTLSETLGIWETLLDGPIRPEDDFFEIGGNSLIAVKLIAELRKSLGVKVALRDLYMNPTPEKLLEHLSIQLIEA
ncbi:MAG: amino acid adenylation domain-containing protein [Pseudoruegeria sp.]